MPLLRSEAPHSTGTSFPSIVAWRKTLRKSSKLASCPSRYPWSSTSSCSTMDSIRFERAASTAATISGGTSPSTGALSTSPVHRQERRSSRSITPSNDDSLPIGS